MAKIVELRRHTAADGDLLTQEGVRDALAIGARMRGEFDVVISSGAQRATQTAACFLAASGQKVGGGVVVDERFRSAVEDRWKSAYEVAGAGDLEAFKKVDAELVETEARLLGRALSDVFEQLSDGARALVVGHSPMQEAAVYGLTGQVVRPLAKGAGTRVSLDEGTYEVEALD